MNLHNTHNPKISVLLVDGSYRPHFAVIDSLKHQTLSADDYEVLWIEYYTGVKQELVDKTKNHKNFHIIALEQTGVYHSSYCFNRGIMNARGELLIIADADVLVEENFLETIWEAHQGNERLVMYIFRMDEPKRSTPLCLDLDYLKRICKLTNPSNYGGCLTVRKKWLLKINGYEQHNIFRTGGDHANGLDIYTRFKNMGMHIMWHPHLRLYHPWHPHNSGLPAVYQPQRQFIDYRAQHLEVLPYNGIDPERDRMIPLEMQPLIGGKIGNNSAPQP